MWKVVKKNKSYDKRMLKIYYNDKLLTNVYPFGGWFGYTHYNPNNSDYMCCRIKVIENLYWLLGEGCSYEDWVKRVEKWDKGKGIYGVPLATGQTVYPSQFHNIDEKYSALESFNNV